MMRFYFVTLFFVTTALAQDSFTITAITVRDTPVDVFPLAIGNQWTYSYDYEWRDDFGVMFSQSDTGTVSLRVINNVVDADSTLWRVQENGSHWTKINNQPWSGPIVNADTFDIVEFKTGNHWMYRIGDVAGIRKSVLPLVSNLADTARVYRYATVDSSGVRILRSHEVPHAPIYTFSFRQDVGLTSVSMSDGMTGFPYYWTAHSLRSFIITGVSGPGDKAHAGRIHLNQNYPNPFNPSTTFSFDVPRKSFVSLKVFDLLGREVATVVSGEMQEGAHSLQWNASALTSGTYFYQLRSGEFAETRRMILIR